MCKLCRLCCFSVLPKYKQNVIEIFPAPDVQPETVPIETAAPSDKVSSLARFRFFPSLANRFVAPLRSFTRTRGLICWVWWCARASVQVTDMCLYAEMAPKKLTIMGKYLLEKTKDYLKVRDDSKARAWEPSAPSSLSSLIGLFGVSSQDKRRAAYAKIGMLGFVALVRLVSQNLLSLFEASALKAFEIGIAERHVEFNIVACQGITKLILRQSGTANYNKFEPFFVHFAALAVYGASPAPAIAPASSTAPSAASAAAAAAMKKRYQQNRARLSALQGLGAMVRACICRLFSCFFCV